MDTQKLTLPGLPTRTHDNRSEMEQRFGLVTRISEDEPDLIAKWRDETVTTIELTHYPDGPCGVAVTDQVPLLLHAMVHAQKAFSEAGAVWPIIINPNTDIRVIEFTTQYAVQFVFFRRVAGKDLEVAIDPYLLSPPQIASLKVRGKWKDHVVH